MFLRPYQNRAITSLWDYFGNKHGNPLVAMPTGTGKSIVQAGFFMQIMQRCATQRLLSMTHVKELVGQNERGFRKLWPMAPAGVYSAGLDRREATAPIVFGGIQSAVKNWRSFGWRDLMVVDEAQLISPSEGTMYQDFISNMRTVNPNFAIVGLTATAFRMGQGLLTNDTINKDGEIVKSMFDDICFDITGPVEFNKLIDDCYLSPLIPRPTDVVIDTSGFRIQRGDFVGREIAENIRKQRIIDRAIAETLQIGYDRHKWLVFAAGVDNTMEIADKLNAVGVKAIALHSKISNKKIKLTNGRIGTLREQILLDYKAGKYKALVVNNIGTVGFDEPSIDLIVDLRPTTSVVLHVQKYGRGTRPVYHPSFDFEMLKLLENRRQAMAMSQKQNCLILDFAGNIGRLGPINDPRIPKPKGSGGGGDIPMKICEACGVYNYTPARTCCSCGEPFVFYCSLETTASTKEVIRRTDANIQIFRVGNVTWAVHTKRSNGKKMLKLHYFCGAGNLFTQYMSFGGGGLLHKNAVQWWRLHSAGDIPKDNDEALQRLNNGECRQAQIIRVNMSKEMAEITEYQF